MLTFNEWREKYSILTDEEQKQYMNDIEEKYPVQIQFNNSAFYDFFKFVYSDTSVIEMGGWKGELANHILPNFPNIKEWVNYELCENAINKSVCNDNRYKTINSIFRWWENADINSDIFVASHSIEHINKCDFFNLIKKVNSQYIFFDIPLLFKGQSWDNYGGTHINTIMWDELIKLLKNNNYNIVKEIKNNKGYDERAILFEKVL